MKLKLILALSTIFIAAPMFAEAGPHTISAHMRPQLFHDRSPHIHDRSAQPHHQA